MIRALVDTNIILDVLFEREEFLEPARIIWKASESGRFDCYISAVTPITIFYVARRQIKSVKRARDLTADVLNVFRVCTLTESMLISAIGLPLEDYEDAVQSISALADGLDFIITRDIKDFANSPIRAITPAEFVKEL